MKLFFLFSVFFYLTSLFNSTSVDEARNIQRVSGPFNFASFASSFNGQNHFLKVKTRISYGVARGRGRGRGRGHHKFKVFDVKKFGASANGRQDDSKAFLAAWKAACSARGRVKLLVPMGTYLLGPVKFRGPCTSLITVKLKGYLKATTDLSAYEKAGGDDWVEFGFVNNLKLSGGGTLDGQGAASWPFNRCPKKKKCQVLPTSLKFVGLTNTRVRGIKSVNSKFFHISLVECQNFWASNFRITARSDSPNTDGIHLDRSTGVSIHNSIISTGDDCISIGPGSSKIILKNIRCGPGHGISVGSLGRYEGEKDVKGLLVKDCVLTGTSNGVRIKTWENSPQYSSATNMTFDNIVMNQVSNPIIIDQTYCPYSSCNTQVSTKSSPSNTILSGSKEN
ncbi:putative glycosidase [Dioscorea sansibarensis]